MAPITGRASRQCTDYPRVQRVVQAMRPGPATLRDDKPRRDFPFSWKQWDVSEPRREGCQKKSFHQSRYLL